MHKKNAMFFLNEYEIPKREYAVPVDVFTNFEGPQISLILLINDKQSCRLVRVISLLIFNYPYLDLVVNEQIMKIIFNIQKFTNHVIFRRVFIEIYSYAMYLRF